MRALFLALQEKDTHRWAPVARVVREDGLYRLTYTRGAREIPGFQGFGRMHELEKEYVSEQLFPLLQNRVLPRSRPEYKDYLSWLGLSESEHDSIEELSRTGGLRATDTIELIPCPEPNEQNFYVAYFFIRGIRHFPAEVEEGLCRLMSGDRLFLVRDVQNEHDGAALLLRTNEPISLVGYAPRYYSEDFSQLISNSATRVMDVEVIVDRVNHDAPLPYRVLCKIKAPWPEFFSAFGSEKFKPIASS
jgi:hypothetical protein